MAKKSKKKSERSLKKILMSVMSDTAIKLIKTYTEELMQRLHSYITKFQKKLMYAFAGGFTLALGVLSLIISIPFLMYQYFTLTIGEALFIAGVILVLIAILLNLLMANTKVEF